MSLSTALCQERLDTGLYDILGSQMVEMDTAALATAEYGVHFQRSIEQWSGNYVYKDVNGAELRTNVFGEIAPAAAGSIVSAKGNHYAGRPGESFRQLDDNSKAKDVLVLKLPTKAPELLKGLFLNQIGSLNAIREADEKEEIAKGQDVTVREWIRNEAGDDDNVKDHIVIHMLPKYGNPNKGRSQKRVAKRTLSDFSSDDNSNVSGSSPSSIPPTVPNVVEGAFYDPHLNADFGGDYFNIVHNKLVQLDVINAEGLLVAPWDLYDVLKPGTLVLICASLHCFVMRDRTGLRKVYQLNAHRVRVVAQSDGQPFSRQKHSRPDIEKQGVRRKGLEISSSANMAFTNFSLTKRPKLSVACDGPIVSSKTVEGTSSPGQNLGGIVPSHSMKKLNVSKKSMKGKKTANDDKMDED